MAARQARGKTDSGGCLGAGGGRAGGWLEGGGRGGGAGVARGGRGGRGRATPGAFLGAAVLGAALVLRGVAGIALEGDDEDDGDLFSTAIKPFDETRTPEIALIFNEGDCDLGEIGENDAVMLHFQLAWSGGILLDTFKSEDPVQVNVGEESVMKGINWVFKK